MVKTTTFVLTVLLTATSPISSGSSAAGTASFYVAKHGSDSYTCSQAANPSTPKASVGAALDCIGFAPGAGANKVVEVAGGTYTESLVRSNSFPKGSSWSAPFTLRAKAGNRVIIRPNSGSFVFQVNDEGSRVAYYAIIQGLTFDSENTSMGGAAVFASYLRMIGNEFINNNPGAIIGGSLDQGIGFEFINNKIYGGPFFISGGSGGDYGYPMYWGGNGALFEGNEIYDFATFGIHIYRSDGCPSNNIVRNNVFYDFGWAANCPNDPRCPPNSGPDDRGFAILACGTNHQVYNNLVFNGTGGINVYTGSGKHVYGNTIYNMTVGGIISNNSDGNVVKNNIVYNPKSPRDGDIRSWQVPDTTSYGNNLCARSGTGCSLAGDPLFVDATNGDFNLQSGSPAAGTGAYP